MFYISLLTFIYIIYLVIEKSVLCEQTFVVSFQTNLVGPASASPNVWIEVLNQIPPTKEFTACHWIRIKYFNLNIAANLWAYCIIENAGDKMKCLQVFLHSNIQHANRDLVLGAYIPSKKGHKKLLPVAVNLFLHRTWSHFCWSFSALNGEIKFYYNGNHFIQCTHSAFVSI